MKHPLILMILLVIIVEWFIIRGYSGSVSATTISIIGILHFFLGFMIAKKFFVSITSPTQPVKETQNSGIEQQLEAAKQQLITQERMASIGMLTAGIAHEIKNPLNFVNNFSDMTGELVEELKEEIAKSDNIPTSEKELIDSIIEDIGTNCKKINEHGKRAESIIKNMLIQTRTSEVERVPIDVNQLIDEYLNLAYHGLRAQNNKFNAKLEKKLDTSIPKVTASPQSLGRVFLNIINNGLYAANEKGEHYAGTLLNTTFMPTITISSSQDNDYVVIKIRDNGNGIKEEMRTKIFEPFFTTKPAGQGTGLGLPICYDIVTKEHAGKLIVESKEGEYTEFVIMLPKDKA